MTTGAHRTSPDSSDSTRDFASFPTTCWSQLVPIAGTASAAALEPLAREYHRPVVAWLRSALRLPFDAAHDVAQEFFAWTIESGFLAKADPARGRFRAFLKAALRNFAADAARRERALKRGGDARFVPLHGTGEGRGVDVADASALPPDDALDRQWRRELIEGALRDVEVALAGDGRAAQFAAFRDYFLAADEDLDYAAIAARHGMDSADVSNALQRVKKLFRDRLKARVVATVAGDDELQAELSWLFGKAAR